MCLRFHNHNQSDDLTELRARVSWIYDAFHLDKDGVSLGGKSKLDFLREGKVPFELRGGSTAKSGANRGLQPLLMQLALLCKEHYQWFEPKLAEAVVPRANEADDDEDEEEEDKSLFSGPTRPSNAIQPSVASSASPPASDPLAVLNHTNVIAAFEANLDWSSKDRKWGGDKKCKDQFVTVKNCLWQQVTSWAQVSKRSSDESLDPDRAGKRIRSHDGYPAAAPGTPQLASIDETMEHAG